MKKLVLVFIIYNLLSFNFSSYRGNVNAGCFKTNEDLPESFKQLLERGKLTFKAPAMKTTEVKEDPLMKYDIAYLDKANGFEIRINIVPLDSNDVPEENLGIFTLAQESTYEAIDLKHLMFNADKAGFGDFMFKKI